MKRDSKLDDEQIAQALEQLQYSVDIMQQIIRRLHHSMAQTQTNPGNAQRQNPVETNEQQSPALKDTRFQHRGHRRRHDQTKIVEAEVPHDDPPKVLH